MASGVDHEVPPLNPARFGDTHVVHHDASLFTLIMLAGQAKSSRVKAESGACAKRPEVQVVVAQLATTLRH